MPRYRVTVQRATVETIDAENPYMAAVAVSDRYGDGATVTDVRPATGRPARRTSATKRTTAKKTVTKKAVAKKRKPLSPAARARLAENLKKARAARARNLKAA